MAFQSVTTIIRKHARDPWGNWSSAWCFARGKFRHRSRTFSRQQLATSPLVSLLSTTCMLCTHKPYRKRCLQKQVSAVWKCFTTKLTHEEFSWPKSLTHLISKEPLVMNNPGIWVIAEKGQALSAAPKARGGLEAMSWNLKASERRLRLATGRAAPPLSGCAYRQKSSWSEAALLKKKKGYFKYWSTSWHYITSFLQTLGTYECSTPSRKEACTGPSGSSTATKTPASPTWAVPHSVTSVTHHYPRAENVQWKILEINPSLMMSTAHSAPPGRSITRLPIWTAGAVQSVGRIRHALGDSRLIPVKEENWYKCSSFILIYVKVDIKGTEQRANLPSMGPFPNHLQQPTPGTPPELPTW